MNEKIKSLFVSDVHIGNNIRNPNVEKFFDVLSKYDYENLFLLGDIFDLRWPLNPKSIELFNFLSSKKNIHYIFGNHDIILKDLNVFPNLYETIDYDIKENKCLLLHGHQHDLKVRNNLHTKILFEVSNLLFDFCHFIENKEKTVTKFIKNKTKNSFYYKDFITSLIEANPCYNTIIFGHLHYPFVKKIDDILIINTGDFIHHNSYVVEDTSGNLELRYI